jgi:cardiolipin synthase A/B
VLNLLIGLLAAGVVPRNRTAGAGGGWLLIFFMLPVLGIVAYVVFGRAQLPQQRKRKLRQAPDLAEDLTHGTCPENSGGMRQWVAQAVRLNRSNGAFPLADGHRIEVLDDYEESLQTMAEAIRGAEHYVHFQFYIAVADDTTEPVIAALEDAHRRGITVRVLIDHLGSVSHPGYEQLVHRLDEAGIPWRRMLPVRPWRGEYQRPDLRNHRKILVIDDAVAFSGSMNVIDRSYNRKKNRKKHLQWVGLMPQVQGPAVGHPPSGT